jgi:uncharacterized membrane protein
MIISLRFVRINELHVEYAKIPNDYYFFGGVFGILIASGLISIWVIILLIITS